MVKGREQVARNLLDILDAATIASMTGFPLAHTLEGRGEGLQRGKGEITLAFHSVKPACNPRQMAIYRTMPGPSVFTRLFKA